MGCRTYNEYKIQVRGIGKEIVCEGMENECNWYDFEEDIENIIDEALDRTEDGSCIDIIATYDSGDDCDIHSYYYRREIKICNGEIVYDNEYDDEEYGYIP